MARPLRVAQGGVAYHVFNRGSRKGVLFRNRRDYLWFETLMDEARTVHPIRIIAYCVLSNHWHFLLWPHADGDLSRYMHWLTGAHASAWRDRTDTKGQGAVYQSRFGAIPIVDQLHFFSVWRYIERNPIAAKLVNRAEDWPWSSAAHTLGSPRLFELDPGPYERPRNWLQIVNGFVDWDIDGLEDEYY